MHSDGGTEKPLRATYGQSKPPWIGRWNKRDLTKGRKIWWTELGMRDENAENDRFVFSKPQLREYHRDYWDPKVPDGTSLAGPMGLDSTRYADLTVKGDQPGDYNDFMNKVYKSSVQYKDIAAAYDLRDGPWPFHKGLKVPLANKVYRDFVSRENVPWWWPQPFRFFNKPLNEAPIIKGLAMAQYTAFLMIPYTAFNIRAFNYTAKIMTPNLFVSRYFKLTTIPATLAFTWGVTLSGAAMARHKDDFTNHYFSSAAVGLVVATMRDNVLAGFTVAFWTFLAGAFWQYLRVCDFGLQNKVFHVQTGSFHGGPLFWKLMWRGGEEKVPDKKF